MILLCAGDIYAIYTSDGLNILPSYIKNSTCNADHSIFIITYLYADIHGDIFIFESDDEFFGTK